MRTDATSFHFCIRVEFDYVTDATSHHMVPFKPDISNSSN